MTLFKNIKILLNLNLNLQKSFKNNWLQAGKKGIHCSRSVLGDKTYLQMWS